MTTTKLRLCSVEEYHRMIDAGIVSTDDKVELLDGRIVQMSPQRPPHASTTQRCALPKADPFGIAIFKKSSDTPLAFLDIEIPFSELFLPKMV